MEKETYLVSEAEKLTGEKANVLRYWEDELDLPIARNSLGHRIYTKQDIQVFLGIRELKRKGLHLKAIRELIPKLEMAVAAGQETGLSGKKAESPLSEGVLEIASDVTDDLTEENPETECERLPETAEKLSEERQEPIGEEKRKRFFEVLDRLMNQIMLERREEERCRRVDEAIRRHQQNRREAAVTMEQNRKKRQKKNA